MKYTLHSRAPSITGAMGEFYHPTKKKTIKAKTISCVRLSDGRYEIIVQSYELEDSLEQLLGFFDEFK